MILAIDQATRCGWAVVNDDGSILLSGVWDLAEGHRSGESRGMRYLRFRHKLDEILGCYPVGMICHEQTLLRGGAATEVANGLKALILMAAEVYRVEVTSVHTTELKKWATGHGNADKRAMVESAERRLGRPVIDDNEADAVLIGLWAFAQYGAQKSQLVIMGTSWTIEDPMAE